MQRRPAKVLEPANLRQLLRHVGYQRYPERNRVMVLLSFKAGLRACEIAGLEWPMILASNGCVGGQIAIVRAIAKGGYGRAIPLNSELKSAIRALHSVEGRPHTGPIVRSERGRAMIPGSVVNWFSRLYAELGLVGCSSHSGRRTFITASARVLARTGGSLRDIQELAGHRSLVTTERYIEGNRVAQRRLISLI